ncbi:MAG: hypothetical protein HYR91_04250 [Flavobacteriia bacterium]|nr:hypothetical protein [Flavobacteriia bacterium]
MLIEGKELERYFIIENGLMSFNEQFNYDNNDRAIVVVGVAYLEDLLLFCLENYFPSNSSTVKKMLNHTGIIGNFSAKTDLLYSLGFISKIIKNDLDKIGQIRNAFAHKIIISFDDEKIKELCSQLKWHEISMNMNAPKEATSRNVFQVGVNTLVAHLSGIASITRSEKRKLKL